jgi:hypothetical protein
MLHRGRTHTVGKKPAPAPVEWHPAIQKLREEADDPRRRLEVERMGKALASMKKKDGKK